jgi:hypothetical protein
LLGCCPAVGAEFGALEHHAQALGAGDGLQHRIAILALRRVL